MNDEETLRVRSKLKLQLSVRGGGDGDEKIQTQRDSWIDQL